MKYLNAPFLELSFYYEGIPEKDAFNQLAKTLLNLGSVPAGEGSFYSGEIKPFGFSHELPLELPTDRITASNFNSNLLAPNRTFVKLSMYNAIGISADVAEILTYVGISKKAAQLDRHPIAIWGDGSIFSNVGESEASKLKVGQKAYVRFLELISTTKPAYAAITIEDALCCPTDLKINSVNNLFRNFFVSARYIDVELIQRIYTGSYIEPVADGLYISCWKYLNPNKINFNATENLSTETAKLIGQRANKH